MKPEDVPEEPVTLLTKLLAKGFSKESALARVLTKYDKLYSVDMNTLFTSLGGYGLEETPDSPAAPVSPIGEFHKSNAKPKEAYRLTGVKVTRPGNPPVVKIYSSVKEAAKGEFVSVTTIRGRLRGMYTKDLLPGDTTYEWCGFSGPPMLRATYKDGRVKEFSSVQRAADALGMSKATIYDRLSGRHRRRDKSDEPQLERIDEP